MKLLFATEEAWYRDIVTELRRRHQVDYIFLARRLAVSGGDFALPAPLGKRICYKLLSSAVATLLLVIRRYDFCITDYHSARKPLLALWAKRFGWQLGTLFVHDFRTIPVGYREIRASEIERRFQAQVRFANEYYQGITLITAEMERHIRAKYGPINKPTCVWQSGVFPELFPPIPKNETHISAAGLERGDFVVLYHGSFEYRRGLEELVEAFGKLDGNDARMKLLLIGAGPEEESLREKVRTLRLGDKVKFHRWVGTEELSHFLSLADLCVVPLPDIDWWRVSSPLKLMEYLSCGKPLLLTSIPAHTHVVGRSPNCFWIDDVTADSIAASLKAAHASFQADPQAFYRKGIDERAKHIGRISWRARLAPLERYLFRLHAEGCRRPRNGARVIGR